MQRRPRALGFAASILLLILLTGPAVQARSAPVVALGAALQTTGGDTIVICHANPSEATPYMLRAVANDATYGGHLAHLDTPVDPANLQWPDLIPAPVDGTGEPYCPSRPPAAPETPTVEPTAPATVATTAPPTEPPATAPVTVPPTVGATAPATTLPTAPSATASATTVPPAGAINTPATPAATTTTVAGAATAPAVTALPVTGAGSTPGRAGTIWLLTGAALALLCGGILLARRARR